MRCSMRRSEEVAAKLLNVSLISLDTSEYLCFAKARIKRSVLDLAYQSSVFLREYAAH